MSKIHTTKQLIKCPDKKKSTEKYLHKTINKNIYDIQKHIHMKYNNILGMEKSKYSYCDAIHKCFRYVLIHLSYWKRKDIRRTNIFTAVVYIMFTFITRTGIYGSRIHLWKRKAPFLKIRNNHQYKWMNRGRTFP